MEYIISTDTGGTFVDAIIIDAQGTLSVGKHSSTPNDPAKGILGAVDSAAQRLGISLSDAITGCKLFFNGTTVSTNAMIQRKGVKTGLLITRGFEDTLYIGRIKARTAGLDERDLTNYQYGADRPQPIVPISLTRGVQERIDFQGKVLCPLDENDVLKSLEELVAEGIESLAICLLWSFKNPDHEQRIKVLAEKHFPHLFVSASSDLIPLMREYERTNTTVINCFLGPVLDRYLKGIEESLLVNGYRQDLLVMQSVGGLSTAGEIRRTPITTLYSGPVGGVIATQHLGRTLGEGNLISTDMGGTSFDVGLIVDGRPQSTPVTVMQRFIVMFPTIDVATVGAGGGSKVWLDEAMTLKVGPMSQGAVPGPACYNLGGQEPTVTDADILLGYISPDFFLGGKMRLIAERSRETFEERICRPLGMSLDEAAWGAYEIINAHMADLIRQTSVERGYDPREFVLVAFGGCGPTHCTAYGPDIGAKRIIVPPTAPVFSALGIAQSDLRHFFSRSFLIRIPREGTIKEENLKALNEILAELLERGRKQLSAEGASEKDTILLSSVDMRYRGQVNELVVPVPGGNVLTQDTIRTLCETFTLQYEKLYGPGSSSELSDVECVSVRVDAIAPIPFKYEPVRGKRSEKKPVPVEERRAFWGHDKWSMTPVYRGEMFKPGNIVEGPAILEFYATTIPLPPRQRVEVDEYSNLIITVEK
jgi:N-methylhydantoinase A